jgi:hypothetical protein
MNAGTAKLEAYQQAMAVATRPEEKRLVLAGVGGLARPEALKLVEPCLEDPAVQSEAFLAYDRIAEGLVSARQVSEAQPALKIVAEKAPDPKLRDQAKAVLDKISQ